MKHSRNKHYALLTCSANRFLLLPALLVWAAANAFAATLHNLEIQVKLRANGEALISEARQATVGSEGTEFYIVMDNMGDRQVKDLRVTDEQNVDFDNIGEWEVNASRSEKTHRCGLVTKANGYEICWGLGESGDRAYLTRYTVTDLLQGYSDYDGFNWMFATRNMRPNPQHVRLTIQAEDPEVIIRPENTKIWGFGFHGNVTFEGDSIKGYRIVAETDGALTTEGAMIVMVQFDKGMFSPNKVNEGSFDEIKNRAMEGSDYDFDDLGLSWEDWFAIISVLLTFAIVPFVFVYNLISTWRFRRKVNRNLLWYRDIPCKGNLQEANKIMNAMRYWGNDFNNLLSACVLKLINMEALHVVSLTNKKGKVEQFFKIDELKPVDDEPLLPLLRRVHNIFRRAAGDDEVLEPKELKHFLRSGKNQGTTDSFINDLHSKVSLSYCKKHEDRVREVLGMRKFLDEFTLLDERSMNEISLWKDYMVYAALFGIAEKVIKEMKKLNPEFFKMDKVAAEMADEMTLPIITSTFMSSTRSAAFDKSAREARARGGGGSSSWGGGGGFSGGGSGGGIR